MTLVSGEAFPRHSHDQFGIGLIDVGGHRSWSAVGQVDAGAGDAIMVNPGELHDGASIDGGVRAWRMLYFEPWLAMGEVEDEIGGEVEIARPAVHDPILAELFSRLFSIVTAPIADRLAADEGLLRLLSHALRQHGSRRPPSSGVSPNVGKARRRLDEAPEKPVSLAELAALVGVSRFQLLRGFAREVGTTPYAYLVQRRVRYARRLLVAGRSLSAAATEAGFADQSHMTRAFTRQFGVSPGRYRDALS
ncbi:MAG: AraC family transcriptional regulator [Roseiarcus sp.]|jgi:AraC-like DNA-binding protein